MFLPRNGSGLRSPKLLNLVHELLNLAKRNSKFNPRSSQAIYRVTQQEFRCRIKRESVKQVFYIDQLPIFRDVLQHVGDVSLKSVQVGNALFEELRSDELTGGMPLLAVCREDAISKERGPFFVE